eukprot:scaffold189407_cov17-Tisochrysis_lutea.AAC.1
MPSQIQVKKTRGPGPLVRGPLRRSLSTDGIQRRPAMISSLLVISPVNSKGGNNKRSKQMCTCGRQVRLPGKNGFQS